MSIQDSSTAEAMFSQLFTGQLEAMARQMATQFNIDPEAAVKMASEHASSIDIKSMGNLKRSRSTRTRKPKAPVSTEQRCMARVWGSGNGNDQCKCCRGEGSEYCSRHSKQAIICEKACQVGEDGKKKGLFCGRIDEFIPGTELAPFSSDGIIRIEWKSQNHIEAIAESLENETCRKNSNSRKTKRKPNIVQVEMNEDDLAKIVTNNVETVVETQSLDISAETFVELGLAEEDDEEEEEGLEVEEWEHEGESYLVCRETLVIYNDEGEEVSKWGEDTTSGAPIPEE
mgnify:CR=1 FL=1